MTPPRRGTATCAAVLLLSLTAVTPAQGCPGPTQAREALETVRAEVTTLYRETSGFEKHLDEALAVRAKERGWDAARTEAFKSALLSHADFQAIERAREAETPRLIEAAARLVVASGSGDPAAVCQEVDAIRAANARVRTVLDRGYAWLKDRIWGP